MQVSRNIEIDQATLSPQDVPPFLSCFLPKMLTAEVLGGWVVAALQLNPKLLETRGILSTSLKPSQKWSISAKRGQDHMVTAEIKGGKAADQCLARYMIQQSVERFRCHSKFYMGARHNQESK